MNLSLRIIPVFTLLLICAVAGAQVQVSDEHKVREASASTPAGHLWNEHTFRLSNGLLRYVLSYHANWAQEGEGVQPSVEGYIGMRGPSSANWYGGGFMNIMLNGKSLGAFRPRVTRRVESGERGLVEVLWETPDAQVRLRFMLEPGNDYLATEVAVTPRAEMKRLEMALNCYPSYFTSWNKRDGWRQVIGPETTTQQGEAGDLDPAKDYWLLYQDRVFDVASEKDSQGPCGLLVVPEHLESLKVRPASYPVGTHMVAKPGVTRWRMAFWDFHGKTNAECLARLQAGAPGILAHLRKLDFTDQHVVRYDPDKERAELERMIAKSTEPEKWRKSLVPLLDRIVAAVEAGRGGDLSAEQKASQAIAEYREAVWDLKFDSLLND